MKKLSIFIFAILLIPAVAHGFGYCGEMPSSGQSLTKQDKQKAGSFLKKTESKDSIKNNCMDCHYMVNLVSKMNEKQRLKWFAGIKDLREVVNEISPMPKK